MSELSVNDNDRGMHRHIISGDVDVYDSLRDIYLGRLVNIHTQGLMIVGDVALEEDRLYELDMHIPNTDIPGTDIPSTEPESGKHILRLGVDCLWTRSADQNGKHWTGFSIIDSTPQAMDEIRKLIASWGEG